MIITLFGPSYFLHPWSPAKVVWESHQYETVQYAYEASKTTDLSVRSRLCQCLTNYDVVLAGKPLDSMPRPSGWVAEYVMANLQGQKFLIPELKDKLLATGNMELLYNSIIDTYWAHENRLGKMIMQIREKMR